MASRGMDSQNIPSKTLLEFYRQKLREWRSKHADLELAVAEIKRTVNSNREREESALKILKNSAELQDTISDLQLCLYKEREHVLRLTAENDQLRIDRANDKRNIQFLLVHCDLKESDLYGLHKKSPNKKKVSFQQLRDFNRKLEEFHESEQDILRLKVKSLEAELKEQTENLRDEIVTLINDQDIKKKEWEMERKLLTQQVKCLNCRLNDCHMRKLDELKAIMHKLEQEREKEVELIEENEKLRKTINHCKALLGDDFPENKEKILKKDKEILQLKGKLYQKDHMIRCFEEQIIDFEGKLAEQKELLNESRELNRKIKERLAVKEEQLLRKLDEERRRRLRECEGFRNDIKLLRSKLQSIERQIRQEKLKKKDCAQNLE